LPKLFLLFSFLLQARPICISSLLSFVVAAGIINFLTLPANPLFVGLPPLLLIILQTLQIPFSLLFPFLLLLPIRWFDLEAVLVT